MIVFWTLVIIAFIRLLWPPQLAKPTKSLDEIWEEHGMNEYKLVKKEKK